MNFKQLFILGALVLSLPLSGQAHAADAPQDRYVQIAELEIDPTQLDRYKAAVEEQIEAAIRLEPGVRVLYAVSETENPARVRVFEVYASTGAYKAHLQAEHFRKYKRTRTRWSSRSSLFGSILCCSARKRNEQEALGEPLQHRPSA